jgi:hydroxymethylbilane synthase
MQSKTYKVATRKSALALRQSEMVISQLRDAGQDGNWELLPLSTQGDERLNWSLEEKGGKGLFTSELEKAVLAGEAELAVHSAKDLPTNMPAGLALAGYLSRESAQDVLILRDDVLTPKTIATSSPRRREQMKRFFEEVEWSTIRGNVQTRLRKIAEGEADATVMAMAGLKRLGIIAFEGLRFLPLSIAHSIPAAGQGAIAVQCREADVELWAAHFCRETALAVNLERMALSAMGGGCHSAAAAHYCNGKLFLFESSRGVTTLEISSSAPGLREHIESAIAAWL